MNLVDILLDRARRQPDRLAFSFTATDRTRASLTYRGLHSAVHTVAEALREHGHPGDRLMLMCSPSIEYLCVFLGVLTAEMVAVPASPVEGSRNAARARNVIADSRPRVFLADAEPPADLSALGLSADVLWLDVRRLTDDVGLDAPANGDPAPARGDVDLAFLQYTSGSTDDPKGVMVTHRNLVENATAAAHTFDFTPESVMVGWLPPFHDIGLIGCIITPLVVAFTCHLMAPSAFLRRPLWWLNLISEVGATDSTAPNFAYRMCRDQVARADLTTLDLSSWRHAMNGAEPVSLTDQAASAYAQAGFRPESFRPCYGMAEATLLISDRHDDRALPPAAASGRGSAGTLFVSCGAPEPAADVRIVNPVTREQPPAGAEGDIWVSSPSVARGYWENLGSTKATFGALTAAGDGPFLRTGVLGFLNRREVCVTGRIKDLMIVHGRNIHPQDLEELVRAIDAALRGRNAAAFEHGGRIVVVVQSGAGGRVPPEELRVALRAAASELAGRCEIPTPLVAVIRRGTIRTTSSGKIQRSAMRAWWDAGDVGARVLATSAEHSHGPEEPVPADVGAAPASDAGRNRPDVEGVVVASASRAPVTQETPLADLGLDSVKIAEVATTIEDEAGVVVPLSLVSEVDTIGAFVRAVRRLAAPGSGFTRAAADARGPLMTPGRRRIVLSGAVCRLPGGVRTPDQLWAAMVAGTTLIAPASPDRMRTGGLAADVVPELAEFAPEVFGIGGEEAVAMDPRQALTLTLDWESLQDAGLDPRRMPGRRLGVYIGASDGELASAAFRRGDPLLAAGYLTTGSASALLANRISYVLGATGPSMVVDTACSSSLVAMHVAHQALEDGDVDIALVGGVNALLDGEVSRLLADAGMPSSSGQVHTFDEAADGHVRGEGGVMLVFEAEDVRTATCPVLYCRVLGSAVNQDGRSNGLTTPSGTAQQEVGRRALEDAYRTPADLGYVEAHGTGTPLGDPVEAHALGEVLGTPANGGPVRLGAAKSLVGHLEAGAGAVGLLRAALIVRSGVVPAQPGSARPSSRVDWTGSCLEVPTRTSTWADPRRTAGVSSFGFGETNGHVVLQSVDVAPAPPSRHDDVALVRVAGADDASLLAECEQLLAGPAAQRSAAVLAAATERSRVSGPVRRWTVAEAGEDGVSALRRLRSSTATEGRRPSPAHGTPSITFLAPGHGAPITGCLAGLAGEDPILAEVLDEFGGTSSLPLHVLTEDDDTARDALRRTDVAQPALFNLAIAVGRRLMACGIRPDRVTGHSVGDFAAACLAGGFDLMVERGRLMQSTEPGAMLLCRTHRDTAATVAAEVGFDVAVVNGPRTIVLSGLEDDVRQAEARLGALGVSTSRLPVTRAFNSARMDAVLNPLALTVNRAKPARPTGATFVSDVDGFLDAAVDSAAYWRSHARHTVDFGAAAREAAGSDVVVELSPSFLLPLLTAAADGPGPSWCPRSSAGRLPPPCSLQSGGSGRPGPRSGRSARLAHPWSTSPRAFPRRAASPSTLPRGKCRLRARPGPASFQSNRAHLSPAS